MPKKSKKSKKLMSKNLIIITAIIILIIVVGVLIAVFKINNAPNTDNTINEPILGTWRDTSYGVAQLEFANNHQYFAQIVNDNYIGNWSKIAAYQYTVQYINLRNSSENSSVLIDYNPLNQTISLESAPYINYEKIMDKILGAWTDSQHVSEMDFYENNNLFNLIIKNNTYKGDWKKINSTDYVIEYSNTSNTTEKYQQELYYNLSNNVIFIPNTPSIYYLRVGN